MAEWSQNIRDSTKSYPHMQPQAATGFLTIDFMGGIGYLCGNSIQILRKDVKRIEPIGIAVFVILLAGWIIFKYLKTIYWDRERPQNTVFSFIKYII
jgi:hypothetical protein